MCGLGKFCSQFALFTEKFTQSTKILRDRRSHRSRQIWTLTRVIRTLSTQARNHTYCQRRHETTLAAQTYTTSEEHIVANYQSELHIIVIFLPLSPSRYISHPGPQIRRDTKSTGPQTPAFAFDSYLALLCIISSILLLMSTFKQNSSMSSTIFRWGNSNFPVDQRIFRKCSVFCGDLL